MLLPRSNRAATATSKPGNLTARLSNDQLWMRIWEIMGLAWVVYQNSKWYSMIQLVILTFQWYVWYSSLNQPMVSCLKKLCTSFLPKGIYKSKLSSQTLGKFSTANFCQAASWRDFCQPRPLLSRSPHPQSHIAADIFWHPLSILRRVFSQDVLSLSDTARAIDTDFEIQNKYI